jgi:hypothetical protein
MKAEPKIIKQKPLKCTFDTNTFSSTEREYLENLFPFMQYIAVIYKKKQN